MSPFTAAFRRPWASELNCEYQIGAPAAKSGDTCGSSAFRTSPP